MPSLSPWDSDDALTALFLFLGAEALCVVGNVSHHWKLRTKDSKLWSLLLPGCKEALFSDSINRPIRFIRDGHRLAVAELGGKAGSLGFVDLCGDILAVCEESDGPTDSASVEVYDLQTRISRRYEKVITGPTALKFLEEGGRHLLVAGCAPRPLIMIDFRATRAVPAPTILPLDGLPPHGAPISWLARAGKGRIIGAQFSCPCAMWLFGESEGGLSVLKRVAFSFPEPTSIICSDMAWEISKDPAKPILRVALAISVCEVSNSLRDVHCWASQLNEQNGFGEIVSAPSSSSTGALSRQTLTIANQNDALAAIDPLENELEVPPNSPQSGWSSAESHGTIPFTQKVAVALDFVVEDKVSVKASWISRPLEFSCGSQMRYISNSIYAIVSFSFCGACENDSIAIAEINSQNGEICKTFELPQLEFSTLTNFQWLGPLLIVVEPTGVLHAFSFEFSAIADGISAFEGFRVLSSYGACVPSSYLSKTPHVCHGLGTCHINCTGQGSLRERDGVPEFRESGEEGAGLSGLWLVLGVCNGEQYRYHLRLSQEDEKVVGGGHDMSLTGTATERNGSWQIEFEQLDESSNYRCDCKACSVSTTGLPMRMNGSWKDTAGFTGSFSAAREPSELSGSFDKFLQHQWAMSGHRFAYVPEPTPNQSRGVILCEWPKPFAFGS